LNIEHKSKGQSKNALATLMPASPFKYIDSFWGLMPLLKEKLTIIF